jgi:AraC family transcriptional regulator of adaptative response/methylated-DNA-[protein]-cysteine methyltransferase
MRWRRSRAVSPDSKFRVAAAANSADDRFMHTLNTRDFDRIARAIEAISATSSAEVRLEDLARQAGLSMFHFQRLFRRWAGVSPKRFQQAASVGRARAALAAGHNVLDAARDAGLSGPGRLHDLFVACDAMTPGEYRARGKDLAIAYGFHASPFGECLVMTTARGVCGLGFVEGEGEAARRRTLADLGSQWQLANLRQDAGATAPVAAAVFGGGGERVPLLLKGTNLQVKVWEALLRIPFGETRSYGEIAQVVGQPKRAARAVGNAVGANAIAWLIPCHRVIRASGVLDHYRWGGSRKRAMLAWERARLSA